MKLSYVPEWLHEKANSIKDALEEAGTPIVVTAHRNADPDALASALAMRWAVRELGYDARLVLPEGMSQPSKRLVREILKVEPGDVEDDPPDESAMAIVLDTASPEQLGKLAEFAESIELLVVIDHHESNKLVEKARVAIHDPHAKATSEIVYMIIRKIWGLNPPDNIKTMLLAGIIYDTRHFIMAEPRTLRVAADLMEEGANRDEALKALQSPSMETPERIARLKAAQRMHILRAGDYLVVVTNVGAYEASAARALLDLGADMALILAERGDTTRIIGRAKKTLVEKLGIHLGKDIMEDIAKQLGGGGGGHAQAAGASVKASLEKTMAKLIEILRERFERKNIKLEPIS